MDHPLVIFDSDDEMIFGSSESPAINSNVHFQIHRLSDAGGMTVSEDHYSVLNEIFGTPVSSPDSPVEDDTHTSTLTTPKIHLPEFLEDWIMEADNEENQLLPSPKPKTPSRPTACPTDNSEEMGSRNVFETLFSDPTEPTPRTRKFVRISKR